MILAKEWSELENIVPKPLPPYTPPPVDLLPSVLKDYVLAGAESINVDVSYLLLPLQSGLGSAIGNSRSIMLKPGFVQPPVIWGAIVGGSGSRKSPALEAACRAILERERQLIEWNRLADEQYAEELAVWESKDAKRSERGPKPDAPTRATCLMDDLTLATLGDALESNPRGVIVAKDELSHWLASMDQFHDSKGSDVSRWLSLHTGVFFAVDRRTDRRSYRLFNPRVCITGGIQPAVLARSLTPDYFERGLPARFLFAAPPSIPDKWTEATIPDRLQTAMVALFERLYALKPNDEQRDPRPVLLPLDGDAKAEYVAFYNECGATAAEADERDGAQWSKLTGYAARLALVGQLARNPAAMVVNGAVMQAACNLARWCGNEAARIYTMIGETPEQAADRKLIDFVRRRDGAVTARDVITNYRPLKNHTEEAESALIRLESAGIGHWENVPSGPRGGKPSRLFRLHEQQIKGGVCVCITSENTKENKDSADADKGMRQNNATEEESLTITIDDI